MGMDQILKGLNNVESAATRKNKAEEDYYQSVKELGQIAVDMIEAAKENDSELSWGPLEIHGVLSYYSDVTRLHNEFQLGFSHEYQFYGAMAELNEACSRLCAELEYVWSQMVIDN